MNGNHHVTGVAIVGMAGRFPGARDIDEFWENLVAGRESITRFTPEQLDPSIPAELREHPRYVAACGVMEGADRFDAAFFGIPPREALLIDPQQRVFLELCWNALEHAGVVPRRFAGSIGVYAGTSNNTYRKLVESRSDLLRAAGEFSAMLACEKDYVATRVAHRLDLHGPALSIHTACSTSLVAIAQAWYALTSGQCDLALAGGINIMAPQQAGYLPVEGGMESSDGHCRPYDAEAGGTVFSAGGAVVALKRLHDAIENRDTIFAVLRGVGVNNDGADKPSFGAPSARGQAAVVRQALDCAGVHADSIGYVEGHGSGTSLGDPIEVGALTRAWREDTQARQFCWLGSGKSNVGHMYAAAGVAGLIKAALSLHHGRIPATLHYRRANPEIDFEASPFKVADRLIDWPRGGTPRRAAVSSFGVGGTNAHVILEEAPEIEAADVPCDGGLKPALLVLSARDEPALQRRAHELADALQDRQDGELPDIAYTLCVGREPMAVRGTLVARTIHGARESLARVSAHDAQAKPRVIFLFPGQSSQHAGMARELVESEPVFRAAFEHCCALASQHLGRDLRALILPASADVQAAEAALAETRYTQPALFAVEYALAEWWESIGVRADAMIGHSSGEYVAACRAGVFTLEHAIALIVARGAAMHAQPRGAMLAVRAGLKDLPQPLPRGVEVATLNAPALTVVAGTDAAIDTYAAHLTAAAIANTRLQVSHAFHSALMDGALPAFRRAFDSVQASMPRRTLYSCVSGLPMTAEQATSADYWCEQLRGPVRFADALQHALAQAPTSLCIEVGPGRALTGLARQMLDGSGQAIASLGPAAHPGDAAEHLQRALGECWSAGCEPDWEAVFGSRARKRVPLPGYPFRGERYWIEPASEAAPVAATAGRVKVMPASVRPAPARAVPIAASNRNSGSLMAELREMFATMSGLPVGAGQDHVRFLELGLDSLALTQTALEIERRFGVQLKFRRLLEDLDSIAKLAAMLETSAPIPQAVLPAPIEDTPAAPMSRDQLLRQLLHNQQLLIDQQAELQRVLRDQSGAEAIAPIARPAPIAQSAQSVELALTDAQMEKWLAGQYGGISNLCYNESFLLTLEGPLNRDALENTLRYVIARHEAFTLSFAPDGSMQRTGAPASPPMQFTDLAGANAEAKLAAQCAHALKQPFDLECAPLLRTQLFRLAPERHVLQFIAHHLVLDGWSEVVLLEEFARSYNAFTADEQPALAPANSWRAYVLENERRRDAQNARQLDYWKRVYANVPEPLALPADRPRSPLSDMDFAAATVRHQFPRELADCLRRHARSQGVTLGSLLLAGLTVLLARLSGQHDFAIGVPFAGQALTGHRNLVGDAVNTLPLRFAVDDSTRFDEWTRAVHRTLLDAAENQDLTLYTLLHTLELPPGAERPHLADIIFSLKPRLPKTSFSGLRHDMRDCARVALFQDLFFHITDGGNGDLLGLDLYYRTALFDDATMRRWISHYEVLLTAAIEHAEQPVATLPLLSADERGQVLHTWNATAREFDRVASVAALVAAQAARTPRRIAIDGAGRTLSYAQLERHSDAIARALLARGVQRGERVGICMQREVELLPALLGIMKSGAAYVPLDPGFPAERLRYMAEHSGIHHVVVLRAEATPEVVARGRDLLELDDFDPADVAELALPAIGGGDLAYVLYTSGSTGQPKGVRVLHRNLVNLLTGMRERPGIGADDVLCAITTLSFDIAGLELYLPLLAGARIALASDRLLADPHGLMQLIHEQRVTMLQTTPSLLRLLLDGGRIEGIRNLKLLVGGEALPRDLAEAVLPRCRELWNLYGPTETTIWSTACRVEPGSGPLPLGTPIANTQIYVLDAHGQPTPPGVTGEIWIGGAGVADGYQDRPELSAERFVPDPFVDRRARMYRTGDLGSLREGVLHFHGRVDNQIKLRGYRIEPGDIEAVALSAPNVRETAAAVREFSASDKRLVLYVAGELDAPCVAQLRERLRRGLPPYMLPQHIEVLEALPKTPNGKIDRKALPMPRSLALASTPQADAEQESARPLGKLESIFMQIWRDLLRVREIGLDDNFFDLGGDSLLAVRVFQRAQELTGVNLPLSTLLTAPTIAGQVAAFHAAGASEPGTPDAEPRDSESGHDPWALLVPIQPRGARPPLFCLHAVGGNVLGYESLARALGKDQPFFGIQAVGLDGVTPPLDSVPAMAARHRIEIQARQPHGPYFLAGRSMGGMIAYEIARQLREEGETIALLALFDTYGPGNHRFELQRAPSLQRIGRRWHERWLRLLRADWRNLRPWLTGLVYWRGLAWSDALRLRWARLTGRTLPHALRYRLLWACHERAYLRYQPPPYAGAITLFRAAEHPPGMTCSRALGWEKAAIGPLEVIEMPGDHDSLIEQPALVPAFRAVLERAQAASATPATPAPPAVSGPPVVSAQPATSAPLTDARQAYLARVWREVIGIEQVRASDNFFELGGRSLLAVEMALRVQRETGVRLSMFKITTGNLATLAAELPPEAGVQAQSAASAWRRMQKALGLAHAG